MRAAPLLLLILLGLSTLSSANADAQTASDISSDDTATKSTLQLMPEQAISGPAAAVANVQPINNKQPVVFTSDKMDYDQQKQLVTLTGQVELSQKSDKEKQGIQTVKADQVTYNQQTGAMTATGHVAMIEPDGNVLFAEHMELDHDLSNAFGQQVSALLADNSRMAGRLGERREGKYVDMAQGVYSPCQLCVDDPRSPPLWQLKADRVHHDLDTHDITYENAWLEFAGIPVFWTPELSHPDPSVKRRQGFLAPTFGINTTVGTSVRTPYYIDIAPDQDLTLSPTFSDEDRFQMAGEYRQRWSNARLRVDASGTVTDLTKDDGTVQSGQPRGHIRGEGEVDLDDTWRTGGEIFLTSDDTYLQRYRISAPDILINRGFVEGFQRRDYLGVEGFYFQDTRGGDRPREPYVIPRITADTVSDPDTTPLGGRFELTAGSLFIQRPGDATDTKRLTSGINWQRTDTTPVGLVTTLRASTEADAYHADNFTAGQSDLDSSTATPITPGSDGHVTNAGRLFPSAQATVSYPLARQVGTVQQTLEPIVSFLTAPNSGNENDIANEDSQDFELDDTNLFNANRFTGQDRVEGGERVTYGLKTGVYGYGGGSSSAFFGQSYSFSDNPDFTNGSGLEDHLSDYVGRIVLDPADWLLADYSFRLDKDTLEPRKHEVTMNLGTRPFMLQTNYLYINQQDIIPGTTSNKSEEISAQLTTYLTDFWSFNIGQRRTLAPDVQPLVTSAGIAYNDECLNFALTAEKDHTERADLSTGTSFFLRLIFKNLGGIETPVDTGNVLARDRVSGR